MTKFLGKHPLAILTLLTCLSLPLYAQTGEAIGIVLTTTGLVEARDASGTIRTLTRRSEIFEQDTILVGADGYGQVKMVDDARISFKPNTEFTFNQYDTDADPATPDSAIMSMVRGGFRTISGSIGDQDQDTYRLDTPMATIGIRGTNHEGLIVGNDLFTGVYDGGTTISNDEGSVDTGIGANYDFTQTTQGES